MTDIVTREKNRAYYQEHREQILRATKEWRKRNREKYRAYQKEYWSKHYRNYGSKNRNADRAMHERIGREFKIEFLISEDRRGWLSYQNK